MELYETNLLPRLFAGLTNKRLCYNLNLGLYNKVNENGIAIGGSK